MLLNFHYSHQVWKIFIFSMHTYIHTHMSVLCVCKCKMTFYLNHQSSVEKAVVFCSVLFAMTWQEILFTKIFFIHLLSRPNYGLYCKLFGKTDEWIGHTYEYIHVCMYVYVCVSMYVDIVNVLKCNGSGNTMTNI